MTPTHNIGDIVILATDTDKLRRMVTGYVVRQTCIMYYLSCGTQNETLHCDFEIIAEQDYPKPGYKK